MKAANISDDIIYMATAKQYITNFTAKQEWQVRSIARCKRLNNPIPMTPAERLVDAHFCNCEPCIRVTLFF